MSTSQKDATEARLADLTVLRLDNLREPVSITTAPPEDADAAAVRFEAINVDNNLVERHPKIALNVVELRVALAMSFLEFREIDDRL